MMHTLANGVAIPRLGLGVFQARRGEETRGAILSALRGGYRHIDTARIYGNEEDVGAALRAAEVPDVFVTTKLWNDDQGHASALRAFEGSRKRLGVDIDLYLLHWPVRGKRLESWRALEELYETKRVRAIGVSNFMVRHLDELMAHARVAPMVNQIEVSPFLQQRAVRARCAELNIAVEAYSPLTKGERLAHPTLVAVARELGRTPAQVLIRWSLQHDMIVLPKSVRPARIAENAAVFDFEIPPAAMATLDGLEEGLVTGWDPRREP